MSTFKRGNPGCCGCGRPTTYRMTLTYPCGGLPIANTMVSLIDRTGAVMATATTDSSGAVTIGPVVGSIFYLITSATTDARYVPLQLFELANGGTINLGTQRVAFDGQHYVCTFNCPDPVSQTLLCEGDVLIYTSNKNIYGGPIVPGWVGSRFTLWFENHGAEGYGYQFTDKLNPPPCTPGYVCFTGYAAINPPGNEDGIPHLCAPFTMTGYIPTATAYLVLPITEQTS